MRILTRWHVLFENFEQLIKDLFNDGALADLEEDEKRILVEVGWIVPTNTRYRFTSKGQKGFIKALRLAVKLKRIK